MSLTKLLVDDLEKPPLDSTEPIVFRPANPPSTYNTSNVCFRKLIHRDVDSDQLRYRRCRILALFGVLLIISLILISGFIFAMFMLRIGPFGSSYPHENGVYRHYKSKCHITLPVNSIIRVGELTEQIFAPTIEAQKMMPVLGDILNISLEAYPSFPAEHILHIFAEGLTVIRTPNRCYIRPMREEMLRAYHNNYVNQLNEGIQVKNPLEGEITSERFYATEIPGIIRNSLVMLWCKGVPAFKLVSQRPPNIPVSEWIPRTPSSPSHDLSILVSGDQPRDFFHSSGYGPGDSQTTDEDEVRGGDDVQYLFSRRSSIPARRSRHRRNIPLSNAMHVKPENLPRIQVKPSGRHRRDSLLSDAMHVKPEQVHMVNDVNSDYSLDCPVIDEVLEDFILCPVSGKSSSSKVKVTRDVIMEC